VGRAKPPARHFDVAQVLRGVLAVRLSAGNGASFSAFRQRTHVRLLPALRFGSGGTCFRVWFNWVEIDGTPAVWLMRGFDMISGINVGFDLTPRHEALV
jgi:hypothetical protein